MIETKTEHVEAVKATVTTEIKSFSDVVKQTSLEKVGTKSLQKTIRTTLEEQDRDKSVMVFRLDELENDIPEDRVKEVWSAICPSLPLMKECYRVGKKKESVDRPIRVTFHSREAAADVLRYSKELRLNDDFKHVYINPDRTIAERLEHKKLVDLLKQKIKDDASKYHYIKNGTICSIDKRSDQAN